MPSTTFLPGTPVTVAWLNETNDLVWDVFNGAVTPATARTALGAVGNTGNETVAGIKTFSSIPVLSGGAIEFPATQIPSANANALDDYEEGNWTPGIAFAGASVGVTYGTATGTYTKIGNRVFVDGSITLTSKGSSVGAMTITGLPFAVSSSFSALAIRVDQVAAAIDGYFSLITNLSTATCSLQFLTAAGTSVTNFDHSHCSNTSSFIFGGFYRV